MQSQQPTTTHHRTPSDRNTFQLVMQALPRGANIPDPHKCPIMLGLLNLLCLSFRKPFDVHG